MFLLKIGGGDKYKNHKSVSAGENRHCLFSIQSEEAHPLCPHCKKAMWQYGYRWRVAFLSNGQKVHILIRRLWCPRCLRIHHELPDFLLPYKRFVARCIEKAINGQTDGLCCENSTIIRWHRWFQSLTKMVWISSLDLHVKGWLPRLVLLFL